MNRSILLCFLLVLAPFSWADPASSSQEWLQIAFEEINYASPIVANASLTKPLADKFVKAMPPVWLTEIEDEGFNLPGLIQRVETMDKNAFVEAKTDSYHLKISKTDETIDSSDAPSYLVIETQDARIPVPLFVTSLAVNGLMYVVEEFKGMEQELSALVMELRTTPKRLLYEQTDAYDGSWMKVSLE